MPKAKHYSADGAVIGEVDLPEKAFGIEPNQHVVWEAVKSFLANQRQGNAATKSRSMVRGGGKKPWRQKGTGRARQGSIRAAQWVGGYTAFGPRPRDYHYRLPKKMRRLALTSVMSQRAADGNVLVVDDLSFATPNTKTVANLLDRIEAAGRKVCVITHGTQVNVAKSFRNIPGVVVIPHVELNVYDFANSDVLLFTQGALGTVTEVYGS